MASNSTTQFDRWQLRKTAAVLLVLVLVVCGVAEVAHTHSDADHGNRPASSCSLCLAVHSPAQKTDVSHVPVLAICSVLNLAPEQQLLSRLIISSALIRPPPAV